MRTFAFALMGLLVCSGAVAHAESEADQLAPLNDRLTTCVAQLPSRLRLAFRNPSQRRRVQIPRRLRNKWRTCHALQRDVTDREAIFALRNALVQLKGYASFEKADHAVQIEATQIAIPIVETTRHVAKKYQMIGSPLLNNFLIHTGIKKAGFCYQWTAELLRSLQDLPWQHFQRQWGVANLQKVTENNAIIITVRALPIATGLVYDPWRGAGKPYWRDVKSDHYQWTTLFSEYQLKLGVGLQQHEAKR
jgi:hypothetical protein